MIEILIIKIVHILLLLFILLAPFYGKNLLFKSIVLLGYIYYKWKIDGSCLLTKIEYYLLGRDNEEQGFIYRMINPIFNLYNFNLNESDFKNNLELYTFYWFIFLIIIYLIRFV
jgi:hypothetical protein